MASDPSPDRAIDLTQSGVTIPSDSENYDSNNQISSAPSSSTGSPLILYQPPSIWGLVRGAAINLILPFVNGLMLGFGELFAHEIAFRLGWSGTKVHFDQGELEGFMLTSRIRYFQNIVMDRVVGTWLDRVLKFEKIQSQGEGDQVKRWICIQAWSNF